MKKIPQAYVGYNQSGRAYIPYDGRLTALKEAGISKILSDNGYQPGWKTKNVEINEENENGFSSYREDGAGGFTKVRILSF